MEKTEQRKPILSYPALKGLLVDVPQIFEMVGDIREKAKSEFKGFTRARLEPYPYSNIISILGGRGSGKTTVFSTIRTILENGKVLDSEDQKMPEEIKKIKFNLFENDLHLNTIVPEVLEESANLLGVILLNLRELIDKNKNKIEKYYKMQEIRPSGGYESCSHLNKSPLRALWESVFRSYLVRTDGFSKISGENFSSLSEYEQERQESLNSEMRLGELIYQLFSEITAVFSSKEECLLYLYIDDADINGRRCLETMHTILRYLKHPNVVVFISGDPEKFEEVLEIQQLLQEKSTMMIKDRTALKTVRDQTKVYIYELMKKVLPISNRYYLEELDTNGKKALLYPGGDEKTTFSTLLSQCLFHFSEEKKDNVLPDCVYDIFDDKPRGVITIWDHIRKEFLQDNSKKTSSVCFFSFKKLLRNMIESNEYLSSYEENLQKQWIRSAWEKEKQEGKGEEAILQITINYDKFINYVTQQLTLSTGGFKDPQQETERKRRLQKELCCIVSLFYFCEKIALAQENPIQEPEGNRYSDMLNAIVAADEEQPVYYSAQEAREVLTLFTNLREKLELDQQSAVYNNARYFRTYKGIVESGESGNVGAMDTRWRNQFEAAKEKFEKSKTLNVRKLVELFDGMEYSQALLMKDQTWETNFPVKESDINTQLKIEKIEEEIVKDYVKFFLENLMSDAVENKGKEFSVLLKNEIEIPKELIKSITTQALFYEANYYIEIPQRNFLSRLYLNNKEPLNIEAKDVIELLIILKGYAIKKLEQNSYIANATVSHLQNYYQGIGLPDSIQVYRQEILNFICEKAPESSLKRFAEIFLNADRKLNENEVNISGQEVRFVFYKNFTGEKIEGEKYKAQVKSFLENKDKDKDKDKGSSWETRRQNAIQRFMMCAALAYIAVRCDELLQDFYFINYKKLDAYVEANKNAQSDVYINLYRYYISTYSLNKSEVKEPLNTRKSTLYSEVRALRQKLEAFKKYYTVEDIPIPNLSRLLKELRNDDMYPEALAIKNELEQSQRVEEKRWNSFRDTLDIYIDSVETSNPYYASTLKLRRDELFVKKEEIEHAQILEDIENQEKQRICQAQCDALLLVAKHIFSIEENAKG